MRTNRKLAVVVIGVILAVGLGLGSALASDYQFPAAVRVNNDGINQNYHYIWSSGMRNIALSYPKVYTVWTDYRDGYPAVYLGTSTDDGNSFATNYKINDDLSYAAHFYPTLAVDQQGTAYVAWMDGRTGIYGVFFAKIGAGYSPNVGVAIPSNADDWAGYPAIAVAPAGDKVFLAWQELNAGESFIRFSRSLNGGISFDAAVTVDSGYYPAVASGPGGEIYLVWMDWDAAEYTWVVKAAKSTNGGQSFGAPVKVNPFAQPTAMQLYPALAVDGNGGVFVAWAEWENSSSTIYLSKSLDGASSFYPRVALSDAPAGATHDAPSVAADAAGNIYVAWGDNRSGRTQAYMAKSIDGGQSFRPSTMISQSQSQDHSNSLPSLAVDQGGNAYVVWAGTDMQTSVPEIYFGYGYNKQNLQNPPVTAVLAPTVAYVNTTPLTVSYAAQSGNLRNLTYSYSVDNGAWSPWASQTAVTVNNLTPGAHTFKIRAQDGIGQIEPAPAVANLTVDYTAPLLRVRQIALRYNRLQKLTGMTFSGKASDSISGLGEASYRLVCQNGNTIVQGRINLSNIHGFYQSLLLNNVSCTVTDVKLIVTVKDKAGNSSTYTSSLFPTTKANIRTIKY